MNTRDLPGSLDFVQCVDGKDTIIQDYAQVDGWQNAEVMDIIAQLEQSITTREIPPVPAVNFHITDDNIGEGGPKQKFARNIAAIETLFKLESENRNATTEEQEILSNYVGWGGLADAFDPDKGNWAKEYQTLKNLLSEDEYAAARASTLNAHYTSPIRLDLQDVKALVSLLRICSNNLNQYAKRANETGSIYRADIEDLQKRLEEIWTDMREVLVRLSSIQ